MNQTELFHENITAAIRSLVAALGGMQKVGHELRPTKTPLDAGKWLSDALSESHPTKLHPEDLLALLRLERAKGLRIVAAFLMRESGYAEPQPIEPEDERAELQRKFVTAVGELRQYLDRLARLGVKVA